MRSEAEWRSGVWKPVLIPRSEHLLIKRPFYAPMPTANDVSSYAATHIVSDWPDERSAGRQSNNGCHPSPEPKQACDPQDQQRYQNRGHVGDAC